MENEKCIRFLTQVVEHGGFCRGIACHDCPLGFHRSCIAMELTSIPVVYRHNKKRQVKKQMSNVAARFVIADAYLKFLKYGLLPTGVGKVKKKRQDKTKEKEK